MTDDKSLKQGKIKPGTVKIRFAKTEEDIGRMIALGRRYLEESWQRGMYIDEDRLKDMGRRGGWQMAIRA